MVSVIVFSSWCSSTFCPIINAPFFGDILFHGCVKIPVCREILNIFACQRKGLPLLKKILHRITRQSRKDKGEKNKDYEAAVYNAPEVSFFLIIMLSLKVFLLRYHNFMLLCYVHSLLGCERNGFCQ